MSSDPGEQIRSLIDGFWMKSHDLRILDVLRRGYGVLLLINVSFFWLDRHRFYGPDSLVPAEVGRAVVDPDTFDLYSFFPIHPLTITFALGSLIVCALCLIKSIYPQLAAALAFFLLTCVHHANIMLVDAEDTVFRLFAFFLVFAPSWSALSMSSRPARAPDAESEAVGTCDGSFRFPAWPVRLFQIQICIIYLAAGIQKTNGAEWIDGTAVYYALRLDDLTLFHLPETLTEHLAFARLLSWSTVIFELTFPFLVWNRHLRWPLLLVAVFFHLMTAYTLNLHLFHPIMIVGLLSFVRYAEWKTAVNWLYQITWGHFRTAADVSQSEPST